MASKPVVTSPTQFETKPADLEMQEAIGRGMQYMIEEAKKKKPAPKAPAMIQIYLVNQATDPRITDKLLYGILVALEEQNERDFAPVWGSDTRFEVVKEKCPSAWPLFIQDKLDVDGALAFHDEEKGVPSLYAETKDPLDLTPVDGVGAGPGGALTDATIDALSVSIGHEICEALVDAFVNEWIDVPPHAPILKGKSHLRFYQIPKETVDSCEGDNYLIGGCAVPNFLYPSYFDAQAPVGTQFDQLSRISAPFSLDEGGYVSLRDNEGSYSTVWGERVSERTKMRVERRGRVQRALKKHTSPKRASVEAVPHGPFPKRP